MLFQAQNITLLIIHSLANLLKSKKTYLMTPFKSQTLCIQTVLIIIMSWTPQEWSLLNYNKKIAAFKSRFISCTRPFLILRSRSEWPTCAIPLCPSSGRWIRTRLWTLMCRFMLGLKEDHVCETSSIVFPWLFHNSWECLCDDPSFKLYQVASCNLKTLT